MTRDDPAYDYFRADAQAKGYTVLADYFRDYGIVPPAPYGRPTYKDREVTVGDSSSLEWIEVHRRLTNERIDKSWGEPGDTIIRTNRHWGNQPVPAEVLKVGE